MKTFYTKADGTQKEVKNLGWLNKRLSEVENITLCERDDGAKVGCKFIAHLSDGTIYQTSFNSYEICKSWIKSRRGLKNVLVSDIYNLV